MRGLSNLSLRRALQAAQTLPSIDAEIADAVKIGDSVLVTWSIPTGTWTIPPSFVVLSETDPMGPVVLPCTVDSPQQVEVDATGLDPTIWIWVFDPGDMRTQSNGRLSQKPFFISP